MFLASNFHLFGTQNIDLGYMVCPKMWRLGIHSNLLMVHHGTTGSDQHIETRSQLEFDLHQPGAVGVTTINVELLFTPNTTIKTTTTTTTTTTTITKTCQPGKRSHDVVRQTAIFHYKCKTSTSNRVQKQPLTWCSEFGVKARLAFQGLNPFQKNLYKIPKMPWFIHVYIYFFTRFHRFGAIGSSILRRTETFCSAVCNSLQSLRCPQLWKCDQAVREVSCSSAKDIQK